MNWADSKSWLETRWPIGQAASMAVLLEASAPKAGNVTPTCAFADMDFTDFMASALAIGPVFEQSASLSVGRLVLDAVVATRARCGLNTNLGTVLLLAPLAKAAIAIRSEPSPIAVSQRWGHEVAHALESLDRQDTQFVYQAILHAKPGGLGKSDQYDVQHGPPVSLRSGMELVATTDAVARQYTNDFSDVLDKFVVWFRRGLMRGATITELICEIQLRWLAEELDGLILRKCKREIAAECQQLAVWALDELLETGIRGTRWQALDSFLRCDGNTRNPGTTADLIAAALFVILIESEM